MTLVDLLSALPDASLEAGSSGTEIRRVLHDSRQAAPGDLFVAIRGGRSDGFAHVSEALSRGVSAVLSEHPAPAGVSVAWVRHPRPRQALALAAARLAGDPSEKLVLAAVTGTNGKTTTAMLLEALLARRHGAAGLIGTVVYRTGRREVAADRTTPDATVLQGYLAEMVAAGIPAAAVEVSSHALALDRVEGCRFDAAVFTNLTQDHLDFHGTFENYFDAKARLFAMRKSGAPAVVNVEDSWGARLAREVARPVTTFAPRGGPADVRVVSSSCDVSGIRLALDFAGGTAALASALVGRFHVENLTAAFATGIALGMDARDVVAALETVKAVPGRLERVEAGQPFPIFVDYAHTEDALRRLLLAVREITEAKIVLVFGCGGDRDKGKRFPMGKTAGELADIPIATSDNPRGEDPEAILAQVEEGIAASGATKSLRFVDRREAIRAALELANPGTVVVIAGKGHETSQVLADREIPFDDRRVAAEIAAGRR
ncbi:MAG TPA: UDP-N-acetylmuramoyl-L-alanyl-D-glutamate--2,6-diaminopimelate ligase [Thermoanaerobaculia bacterium]